MSVHFLARRLLRGSHQQPLALAIVELDAVRLLRETPGGVSTATHKHGIFLNASASIVDKSHIGGLLSDLILGIVTSHSVHDERG